MNASPIGVSVGKNLWHVMNAAKKGDSIVAFDLERINPSFQRMLFNKGTLMVDELVWKEKELKQQSLLLGLCSVRKYGLPGAKTFDYLNCDEFDGMGWHHLANLTQALPKSAFNFVFSDALHSPTALEMELGKLLEFNMLDKTELVFVWDDMGDFLNGYCAR